MEEVGVHSRASHETPPSVQKDLLLLIFIHGFKGTDHTFAKFPQRLQHILSATLEDTVVESVVFPAYETKGELNDAVVRFADWLANLTVQREVANGTGGGADKARIVLCGHSMGGLVAADALIEFVHTRPDTTAPLWPNIVACIAFDTPYLGLHPSVLKNSATQATSYVTTARDAFSTLQSFTARTASSSATATISPPPHTPSPASPWQKWAPAAYAVSGALIAGAAAGTAFWRREDIGVGYNWAADHMKYVGTLWDEDTLHRRLERLLDIEQTMGVIFRTFYTNLPPRPPTHPDARTFAILPKSGTPLMEHFLEAENTLAKDELQAHTGMFDSKTNDGYYELGLSTAEFIRGAVAISQRATAVGKPAYADTSGKGDDPAEWRAPADSGTQEDLLL